MQNLNELAFQKACLIQLTTSVWTASKSIESGLLEQIGQNSEWVKGRKYLINPEILGQVKTAAHQARNKVKKYALPFPIMSIQLIPKEYVSTVEEILQHYKQQFWDRVCVFEEMYADAREEAKQELGNLFNEADYPANIKSKFKFDWLFLAIQLPDKTSILSPEIYEREKMKFEKLMNETQEMCMIALRQEFADLVNQLVNKLSTNNGDRSKIVANSMFNKLNEFFSEIQTKNIFQDEELINLTEEAKQIINNISPYSLKYNKDTREQIHTEMQNLQNTLKQSIIDLPRRQIRLEQEEAQ